MKVLLDTQVWLWSVAEPHRLSTEARNVFLEPGHELFLSAASAWEIAIKYALGKLPLPEAPSEFVPSRMRVQRVHALPVSQEHALRVASLPDHHRDPFDRLLVAQAQTEGWTLATADAQLRAYAVSLLWAGA